MKNIYLLTAISVLALSGTEVWAASETATGDIKATIVQPLTVTQQGSDGLNFGVMLNKANDVTVDTAGNRSATNSAGLVGGDTGVQAGKFDIAGPADHTVTVSTDKAATVSSGSATMEVGTFQLSNSSVKLSPEGKGEFSVGATLTVAEGQAAGEYSGNYTVTATY